MERYIQKCQDFPKQVKTKVEEILILRVRFTIKKVLCIDDIFIRKSFNNIINQFSERITCSRIKLITNVLIFLKRVNPISTSSTIPNGPKKNYGSKSIGAII